jgi:hypothetical protein
LIRLLAGLAVEQYLAEEPPAPEDGDQDGRA